VEGKISIAIFASGSGSNAAALMQFFEQHPSISINLIVTNNADAGVINRAETFGVPTMIIDRETAASGERMVALLKDQHIDYIVLAGYLKLVPKEVIQAWPEHIINIHPGLLPKFGGKGMYGLNVHRAVIEQKEQESGLTIHLVNEVYDEGKTLFEKRVEVRPGDTPEELAARILQHEHQFYPSVVESYILTHGA